MENGLKVLWDRVKLAGETITRLRDEKKGLEFQITELGERVGALELELRKKEDTIKKLAADVSASESHKAQIFENGEREVLTAKLKDILSKIDAYL